MNGLVPGDSRPLFFRGLLIGLPISLLLWAAVGAACLLLARLIGG